MKYIVIDHSINLFLNNKILDKADNLNFPGASVFNSFIDKCEDHGWEILTADVFLRDIRIFDTAITLSNEYTTLLPHLIKKGVQPGLLISGEPPFGAPSFYKQLPKISGYFPHAYLFRGAFSRLDERCKPHTFYWPVPNECIIKNIPYSDRKVVCIVSSYHSRYPRGFHDWVRLMRRGNVSFITSILADQYDPSFRCRDLYFSRLELIRSFAPHDGFSLFGNWNEEIKLKAFGKTVFGVLPRPCSYLEKPGIFSYHRFALTLESCIYPGFVTEKIFDAFRAGTVPVYRGAPDIEEFVPADCFIDYRQFRSPETLWDYLIAMPENIWMQYRDAACRFMSSSLYQRHLEENVASQWLQWIEEAADRP